MSSNEQNQNQIAGALTYPVNEGRNEEPIPVQPRQPRNLQGLLRFAMEATKSEDAPGSSTLGPLDEERRKFLDEALKSMTVDMKLLLMNSIRTLKNPDKIHKVQMDDILPEEINRAFTEIVDVVDNLDVAQDFSRLGGFEIFPLCYTSENPDLRAAASNLLAELCQNNPTCQAKALEYGLVNVLVHFLECERGTALIKCIYALSCICREYEPACQKLMELDGCEKLINLLQETMGPARVKISFFMRHLVKNFTPAREKFAKRNLIYTIAEAIKSGRQADTENVLDLLNAFLETQDPMVLSQARSPSFGLKAALEVYLKNKNLQDEEKEYVNNCLAIINAGETGSEVDR